jgi:phytoene dehydrogenase-like protein
MYDNLIIGSDLSALVTALASNQFGLKTVLVTERDPDDTYTEEGYTFPADPLPLAGIAEAAFKQGRRYLDLPLFPDEPFFTSLTHPCFQVLSRTFRLDIFQDREATIIEMIREFPEQEKVIRDFYRSLGSVGGRFADWLAKHDNPLSTEYARNKLHLLRRFPFFIADYLALQRRRNNLSHSFNGVLDAQQAVFSSFDCSDHPLPLSAAYALTLPWRGIFYPRGGRSAWMGVLYRQFESAGGVLIKNCEVIRLETDSGIIADLNTAGAPLNLRSHCLVVSTQWEKIDHLLLGQKRLRRLKQRIKAIPCAGYPFSLHMGVREAGLPEGLAPYAVLARDIRKPAREGNLLFLETSLPADKERAPVGRRAMTATVFLTESPLILGDDELRDVIRDIFSSLEALLPFLRENLDFLHMERSIDFSRSIQEVAQRKYTPGKGTFLGLKTFAPKTPLPHVFLTGGLLRPGLGFEGEIRSGVEAAGLVRDALQRQSRSAGGGG